MTIEGGGGSTRTVSLTVKYSLFFDGFPKYMGRASASNGCGNFHISNNYNLRQQFLCSHENACQQLSISSKFQQSHYLQHLICRQAQMHECQFRFPNMTQFFFLSFSSPSFRMIFISGRRVSPSGKYRSILIIVYHFSLDPSNPQGSLRQRI